MSETVVERQPQESGSSPSGSAGRGCSTRVGEPSAGYLPGPSCFGRLPIRLMDAASGGQPARGVMVGALKESHPDRIVVQNLLPSR